MTDTVERLRYAAKASRPYLFVRMPSVKEDGEWVDQFHPITKEGRQELTDLVLESFRERAAA